jgi:hypothetical protein
MSSPFRPIAAVIAFLKTPLNFVMRNISLKAP